MEDMIKEENILKVKDYIEHLDHKNHDSIANFDMFLDWIDINYINLNYEEIIALINTDDYFKKMIFDVCSSDKINYDNLDLNEAKFIKNLLKAYKRVQDIENVEKNLEDFNLNDTNLKDINLNSLESDPLNFYLSQAPKRLLTREEVIDLCKKRDLGSQKAREILAEYNMKLVAYIAIRHKNAAEHSSMIQGIDVMDLISAGNEGLMIAIDKYNYKLGWSFSTYATWWIMQSIRRTLATESRTIRIPVHVHEAALAVKKASSNYFALHGKNPSEEELVKLTNLPLNKVHDAMNVLSNFMVSLDAPVELDEESDSELANFVEDTKYSKDSFDKKIFNEEFKDAFINSKLTEKEKFVVLHRFGFIDGEVHTLEEIGQMMGVTRERVRQIESKSIRKLRKDPKIKKFA